MCSLCKIILQSNNNAVSNIHMAYLHGGNLILLFCITRKAQTQLSFTRSPYYLVFQICIHLTCNITAMHTVWCTANTNAVYHKKNTICHFFPLFFRSKAFMDLFIQCQILSTVSTSTSVVFLVVRTSIIFY